MAKPAEGQPHNAHSGEKWKNAGADWKRGRGRSGTLKNEFENGARQLGRQLSFLPPMKKIPFFALLTVAAIGNFTLSNPLSAQPVRLPLENAKGLTLHHVAAEPVTFQGKKGIRLTMSDETRQRMKRMETMTPEEREKNLKPEELTRMRRGLPLFDQIAIIDGLEFSDGVIELEVAGAPETGAAESARGFVGIAFRTRDQDTFDVFYLRPTNARVDDQERRNRTVQYMSHPEWPWPRLRRETPAKYESYVDLVPGEWTKLRVEVQGEVARFYVHDNKQPTLVVKDVKTGSNGRGGVALWIGPETIAHFRNLTVQPASKGK